MRDEKMREERSTPPRRGKTHLAQSNALGSVAANLEPPRRGNNLLAQGNTLGPWEIK